MPAFTAKYTPEQREAVVYTALDRGIGPGDVAKLAAAGELKTPDGDRLDPFEIPVSTVASYKRRAHERRMGREVRPLSGEPPRDAMEAIRRRFINMLDAELALLENKRTGKRDPQKIRELARAAREAAAIPGAKEATARKPGTRVDGKQPEGATRSGLANGLLSAHRAQTATSGKGRPRPDHATGTEPQHAGAQEAPTQDDAEHEEAQDDGSPGSSARALDTPHLVPAA